MVARVTAYAQRMLDGLERLEWSDSLKEIQRNWIGRSEGAQVFFDIQGSDRKLEIFTTRPDTIFGVTFMVIAPEHEWVHDLTTSEQRAAVEEYIAQAKKRSERERIAETKRVSGVATGSYAINPFTGKAIPIYISDYVLAGYGTGRSWLFLPTIRATTPSPAISGWRSSRSSRAATSRKSPTTPNRAN